MFRPKKIVSLVLENFKANEDNWKILQELYKEILVKDASWHFFWEGYYVTIRCSKSYLDIVVDWLKNRSIPVREEGEWVDNIDITRKYQHEFKSIFHNYSVLAMKLESGELQLILDRIAHCFLNPCTMTEDAKRVREDSKGWLGNLWESLVIGKAATERAYVIGWVVGNRGKKRITQEKVNESS